MARKRRRTFEEWLKVVHEMTIIEYYELNESQQKALWLEYMGW